jgi:glutamate--cysteine ligase
VPADQPTLSVDALRDHLTTTVFQTPPDSGDRFGLELELIPLRWSDPPAAADDDARPRHVPLHGGRGGGTPGLLEIVSTFARRRGLKVKSPEGHLTGACPPPLDGDFTFEPGGQPEFSGAPRSTPAAAYHEAANICDDLTEHARRHDIELLTIGFNPWLDTDEIGLNTDAPRYVCMDAVYESIGPYGRRKMRQSATIHVNLDFGGPERWMRRWRAAQLLAPLALATFAYSPVAGGVPTGHRSHRGFVWTRVDPSRCGFPRRFLSEPLGSPVDQYLAFALDARVLMLPAGNGWEAQTRPLTFRDWLAGRHDGRPPTIDDWANHLTTLFPEVRPRGFLELRSADSQARAFWSVPLSWWTALLCDDTALEETLAILDGDAAGLETRYLAAAEHALDDPAIARRAVALYESAGRALARFPCGTFSEEMLRAFAVYGERFTLAHRTPADELLEVLATDPPLRDALAGLNAAWCRAVGSDACTTWAPTAAATPAHERPSSTGETS